MSFGCSTLEDAFSWMLCAGELTRQSKTLVGLLQLVSESPPGTSLLLLSITECQQKLVVIFFLHLWRGGLLSSEATEGLGSWSSCICFLIYPHNFLNIKMRKIIIPIGWFMKSRVSLYILNLTVYSE